MSELARRVFTGRRRPIQLFGSKQNILWAVANSRFQVDQREGTQRKEMPERIPSRLCTIDPNSGLTGERCRQNLPDQDDRYSNLFLSRCPRLREETELYGHNLIFTLGREWDP